MKRFWIVGLWVVVLGLNWAVSSNAGGSVIPSYYDELDFLSTAPSIEGNPAGGYINPAAVGMSPDMEMQYFWSDKQAKLNSIGRWGFFTGVRHLGFGVIHQKLPLSGSITDYRLSLAFGNKNKSFGVGYGWSRGEVSNRSNLISIGSVNRFSRFVTLGSAIAFASRNSEWSKVIDLGVRPLGNAALTLLGDAEIRNKDKWRDIHWGAGVAIEPLPGLQINGKYFDDKSFRLGMSLSFGLSALSSVAHFDKKSNLGYTTYGCRLGYPTENIFDKYFKKNKNYLSMDLKGEINYRKYRFFDDSHTLSNILFALDDAAKDNRIAGVVVNLSGAQVNREFAWEIRQKLAELQKAGKKVVIYFDNAEMSEYHLASVADKIVMNPQGMIMLPGYVATKNYYHNLLEKVGVGFDEWRFFTYKSAAESFSREKMSDADKEQLQALVDDRYALVREDVVNSRHISSQKFDNWVNQRVLFSSQEALSNGLVDTLGRWEDMDEIVKLLEGKKKKMVDTEGLANQEFASQTWSQSPKIAIVYALGMCAMDEGIDARHLESVFKNLKEDKQIKAVVFRVDSPGGDPLASDIVAEALKKCAKEKPVIVSQGSVAASGGYWISMYGDTIVAAPNTITGSIGVIGGWIWNKGIGSKLGITSDHVQVGEHADFSSGIFLPLLGITIPDRPFTTQERNHIESYIRAAYKEFVDKVAWGRKMTPEAVDSVGQGRVWSGIDGKEKRLVDVIGGLDKAIALARKSAKIPMEREVEIVELPKMGLFSSDMFKPKIPGLNVKENSDLIYLKMISEHPGQPLPITPPDLCPED